MKRLESLQGLRACAFFAIFLGHCGLFGLSGMGVSLFLVLSGFLMVYNYYSKSDMSCGFVHNIKFSIRKVKKLYPLHLLMILPMLLLTVYEVLKSKNEIGGVMLTEVFPALSASALLIQAWFPKRDIYFGFNGVAWYLSVSMFLYFIFPYILRRMKKCWTRKKAFYAIGVAVLLQLLLALFAESTYGTLVIGNTVWFTYIFPLYRSGEFFVGCNLGYLFLTRNIDNKELFKSSIAEIFAIVGIVSTYFLMKSGSVLECIEQAVIYVPGVSLLIWVIAKQEGIISSILRNKLFVEIGNISAYTFLIHQVVINFVEILGVCKSIMPFVAVILTFSLAYVYMYIGKDKKWG